MKRFLPVAALFLFSSVPFPAAAASPTEGLTLDQRGEAVVFRVERADTDSIRVQVFDHERDTVFFDSGWSPDGPVEWRPSTEVVGPWRYRVEARDGRGALVLSHTGIRDAGPLQAAPQPSSHGPSVMNVGSAGSTGSLRTFLEGSAVAVSQLGSHPGGGRLRLLDEEGFSTALIEPDSDGTGIFMRLFRDQGDVGLLFDGNGGGSGEPLMALMGSERTVEFDLSKSGPGSVSLPPGSIHSFDIFNEAGVASNNTSAAPTSSTLLARSITVPAAGYVLAIGTVEVTTHHFEETSDLYDVGISLNSTTIPSQQAFTTFFSASVPTGVFTKVVTVHGIFQVLPGQPNTFRLILDNPESSAIAETRQLSLVFLPTAYGTVSGISSGEAAAAATEPAAHSSESPEDLDRIAAEEFTRENLARELRVMEGRLEHLERLLEDQGSQQQR